jgi:hypothetical protein
MVLRLIAPSVNRLSKLSQIIKLGKGNIQHKLEYCFACHGKTWYMGYGHPTIMNGIHSTMGTNQ